MNPAAKSSGRTTASAVTTFNRRRCTAPRSGKSLSITCACAPISPELTSARSQNSLNRHRTEARAITDFTRIRATIKPRTPQGAAKIQSGGRVGLTALPIRTLLFMYHRTVRPCSDCKAHNRACRSHRNRPLPSDYILPQSLAHTRCRCGWFQTNTRSQSDASSD